MTPDRDPLTDPRPGDVVLCNRCGECCRRATACDIKRWMTGDGRIAGVCDQLIENDDGTTSCQGIAHAFAGTTPDGRPWHEKTRLWLTTVFAGRGCEQPHLRLLRLGHKEIA